MKTSTLLTWVSPIVVALSLGSLAAADDIVVLNTGETLRGTITENTPEHIILHHPVLGDLTITADQVQSFTMGVDDAAATEAVEAAVPVPAAPTPVAEEPAEEEDQWENHFDLGVSGSAGNTEDTNLRLAIKSIWTRPMNVITLDSSFLHATSNGDATESRFTAGIYSEWPQPDSRWSYFAQARFDYDDFNTWLYRITGGAGVAYRLIDIDEPVEGKDYNRIFQLKLRAGLGFAREFKSMNEDIQPEAILGADLLWSINSWQDLTASTTLFPNLENGEYRLVNKVEWVLKLQEHNGVSLKFGLEHEYQSAVAMGVRPNDFHAFAALGIDF